MATIRQRDVDTNGIRMRITEAGDGPLVVLLHGFPELGHSWRHQLEALAAAGYHAVAPDQRGYGGTDAPADDAAYTQLHLVGDVVGLIQALGADDAVVVGHDWGSPVAAHTALFRPDLVRGVGLLSVPYLPRGDVDILTALEHRLGPDNYQAWLQTDAAHRQLEADPRRTMQAILVGWSGDAPRGTPRPGDPAAGGGLLPPDDAPLGPLPGWLAEEDLDHYARTFARTGFGGALRWYRVSRTNWELTAPWHRAPLAVPGLYIGGDRDPVLAWPGMRAHVETMGATAMPGLRRSRILDGCGHWTQQERPEEVSALLLEFLADLPDGAGPTATARTVPRSTPRRRR